VGIVKTLAASHGTVSDQMRSTHYGYICSLLISNVNIESLCSTKICESICRETFHAVYYFLLFLACVKQIISIFHFTMLAGLHELAIAVIMSLRLLVYML